MENTNIIKTFKTHEPTGFQKLMQLYWLVPKRKRLDTLTFDGRTITVKTKTGESLTAPISELYVRFSEDDYDRRQAQIKHNMEKISIMEIPHTMTDEEWDEVFDIFNLSADAKTDSLYKTVGFLRNILDFFK